MHSLPSWMWTETESLGCVSSPVCPACRQVQQLPLTCMSAASSSLMRSQNFGNRLATAIHCAARSIHVLQMFGSAATRSCNIPLCWSQRLCLCHLLQYQEFLETLRTEIPEFARQRSTREEMEQRHAALSSGGVLSPGAKWSPQRVTSQTEQQSLPPGFAQQTVVGLGSSQRRYVDNCCK